jgi:MoaA/NifB/PqqE/SkfB family radical SAM enzyme
MEKSNGKANDHVSLLYRGVPAETLAWLYCNGIAYEPMGTIAHQVLTGISKGMDKERLMNLSSCLSEWQCDQILKTNNIFEKYLKAKRSLDERMGELGRRAWEAESESGMQKVPIRMVAITEKCNRGCWHCAALADMGLGTMPYRDLENYLELIFPKYEISFSYGEPLLYRDSGKDFGDVVKLVLDRFQHIGVAVVTSGIRSQAEEAACMKLAKLGYFDKGRIAVTLSVRPFMDEMESARRTLKFFIENGIRIIPRIYGVPAVLSNRKWKMNAAKKGEALADLLSVFGIRHEDAMKMPTDMICKSAFCYMGRMAKEWKNVRGALDDYFGKDCENGQTFMIPWDSRKGICYRKEFGLMPDGSIVPGCCHFISSFLRLGSLRGANLENISEITKQMKEDAHDMLIAARKGNKAKSCVPCFNWFRKRDKEGGRIGIRDAERLRKAIPAPSKIIKLKSVKVPVPANFI